MKLYGRFSGVNGHSQLGQDTSPYVAVNVTVINPQADDFSIQPDIPGAGAIITVRKLIGSARTIVGRGVANATGFAKIAMSTGIPGAIPGADVLVTAELPGYPDLSGSGEGRIGPVVIVGGTIQITINPPAGTMWTPEQGWISPQGPIPPATTPTTAIKKVGMTRSQTPLYVGLGTAALVAFLIWRG